MDLELRELDAVDNIDPKDSKDAWTTLYIYDLQMKKSDSEVRAHTTSCRALWRPVDRRSFASTLCLQTERSGGKMEVDSETPCFEKTMTHTMLQKNERVMLPRSFIRTHGHLLDTVISLKGSYGQGWTVAIKRYAPVRGSGETELRFFFGLGWKEFVKENGFQVGDCVLFRLVGNSCLHVQVSSELQDNAVVKTTPLSSKFEKERHGLGKSGREDEDGDILQPKVARLLPKVKSERDQATAVPKCEFNYNPEESPARPWRGIPRDNVKEVVVIHHPRLSETNYNKYPGLEASISLNSRVPQFISKLTRIHLSSHDIRLEIPLRFAKEYGHKFQERVNLLGPNGKQRVVKIRTLSSFLWKSRVQLRYGWRAFSLENGFKEGDVLLFSLVELNKFLVQVFPVATQ